MPGANYMGGRRNSARARTKDVAGRTQKGHFMKQKHQILVRGLRNNSLDDAEHRTAPNGRIQDITFAHARRNLQHDQNTLPTRNTSAQPRTPSRGLLSSSSPHSIRQRLLKRSKILEDLDTIEPTGLKATVQRILRQPDLAGLNRLNSRLISHRYKGDIDLTGDDPRKRPRADEAASSTSSSSFCYESPTRKGTSSQPQLPIKRQLHQPLPTSNDNRPYSDSHNSGRSSSVLVENSISGSKSFGFSDRFSPLQDAHSNSSYPDSGFSELQFSDVGEKEHEETRQGGTDAREFEAEDCYMDASSNSSFFSNASLPLRAREYEISQISFVDAPPQYCIAAQLRQSELSTHQELSVPYINNANEQHPFPLAELHESRSSPRAATSHHQTTGIESQRFGVGYAPSDLNTDYKPFVPLTTMLPSYSEEDVVLAEDGMNNTYERMNMLMDIAGADDQMDDELLITEGKSTASDARHRITGSSSRSSPNISDRPIFQTPARRVITSPTLRSSAEHQSRSTVPLQATVSSILALDDGNEVQNPFYSDKFALHTRDESTGSLTFSKSPVWFIPDNEDRAQNGVSARRDEDDVHSAFSNLPSLVTPHMFDDKATDDEGDHKAASIAEYLPAHPSLAGGEETHSVASPGSGIQLSPLPEVDGFLPDDTRSPWTPCLPLPSPAYHDADIPDVFDGPDIFADIDDEDE